MKSILMILSGLFMVCSLPIYSANKQLLKIQGKILEVSSLEELDTFLEDQKIVFIDFYKNSCPPCEQFKPLYESWARLFDKQIIFIKINASNPKTDDLCKKFNITGLPTLIVLDNQGEEIAKHTGMEEIKKMNIKKFLAYVRD
ncbi:thioredoxin family protein [Candidatus Rhabdochlamydia porcellionis]|jgi:thioredoxin 1|uniref:Thiol:disulfide interchange protein DsbD n=1 Tax=Candidatus Rhabdochlamydia porcellionis TaxID=225148 RepID=A0ABX8Z0Y1_9BACT|nr:thioredoxin family protein [Candidatus Rhabdochlamydia porcellionis]QZA59326.1 Thiol:disulfide interchange protein DsbD [Candidatus Rhabdochlamydia porcellionis]